MRKVEVTVAINVDPSLVIAAFTEPEMLRDWWNVERVLIEKKAGGVYTLAWGVTSDGMGFVSSGVIKEYKSEALLVIEKFVYLNPGKPFLGPMTLTLKVKPKGEGTELYLCQDGYQSGDDWDWYYDAVKEAWPAAIKTLKNYLER
jgi:uncharacterized protein YndB with AHSA1/START domain